MGKRYICALRNRENGGGMAAELFYTDPAEADTFARQWDKPGFGVYDCIGILKDTATRRCKEEVEALDCIIVDLDSKYITQPKEEIIACLGNLVLRPSEDRDSGNGLHGAWFFKEPVTDEAGMAEAEGYMKQMVSLLAGDPAPTHRASLLRRVGTHNSKDGKWNECRIIRDTGARYDPHEFATMFEMYNGTKLLTHKAQKEAGNGHATTSSNGYGHADPVDAEAELAAMTPGTCNEIHTRAIPSLFNRGMHPDDILDRVLEATLAMAAAHGTQMRRADEIRTISGRVTSCFNNLLMKGYDYTAGTVPPWVCGDFHKRWIEILVANRHPSLSRNRVGFFLRAQGEEAEQPTPEDTKQADRPEPANPRQTEHLKEEPKTESLPEWPTPYSGRHEWEIPMRRFLFGQHHIRGSVTLTAGPGGVGKSQLSLLEAVSMASGINLLTNEKLQDQLRVWVWNAEDDVEEMERRVVGICGHYGIDYGELTKRLFLDSGHTLPLELAQNNGKVTFSDVAIGRIASRVRDKAIDVTSFDPLVAVHSLQESDNVNLGKLVRSLDHKVAKPCNCNVELLHHTRKPGVSQESMTADDIRGAGSIVYSTRSGRLLIPMSAQEAGKHGIQGDQRHSYLRLERAKANMARRGTICWLKLVERPLLNGPGRSYGDVVTIPTLWTPTDIGAAVSETVAAAICAEVAKGEYRRDQRAANWIGNLIGRRLNFDMDTADGKHQAKQVLGALIKREVLKVVVRADGKGRYREYIVPGSGV
jgi:AAA domain